MAELLRAGKHIQAAELIRGLAETLDDNLVILSLIYLGEAEARPFDISALAAAMRVPRPTMHRLLSRLELDGKLRITVDDADRRRSVLRLTPKGEKETIAYLGGVDQLVTRATEKTRAKTRAPFVGLRKERKIDPTTALPILRRLYEWAMNDSGNIPLDLLEVIFCITPDFSKFPYSKVGHWGRAMQQGRTGPLGGGMTIARMCDGIGIESSDYFDALERHYQASQNTVTIHEIEIDWASAGSIYQRILIPHPRIGMIGCTRFVD